MIDQFNRDTYKKETLFEQFYGTCLGKILILVAVLLFLMVMAIISVPSHKMMQAEIEDNIHQCLQENDSIKGDVLDEMFNNIGRSFGECDSTFDDREMWETYQKYNKLEIYNHTFFSTAYLRNNLFPQGVRVGIGFFGFIISTLQYNDMVLSVGTVRGSYNQKLIKEAGQPEEEEVDLGENPGLKPFHYNGNPDD